MRTHSRLRLIAFAAIIATIVSGAAFGIARSIPNERHASRPPADRAATSFAARSATSSSAPSPSTSVPPSAKVSPCSGATCELNPVQRLVAWHGPVEHLFFHALVLHPELAFRNNPDARGFRDYYVTVGEFRKILQQMDRNKWSMVDIHDAVNGVVKVPRGRKPFVLSVDDVNYYDNTRALGLGWRLVLGPEGNVQVELHDERGVHLSNDDIVPIVDQFVTSHPDFSTNGAKGLLAPTGNQGVFGERINRGTTAERAASIVRARAVARRLRVTGWTFASHSYGHIDDRTHTTDAIRIDAKRWLAEMTTVLGPTDVYIFPLGSTPPLQSDKIAALRELGFTVQCGIDAAPRLLHVNGITYMARRHIDGLAFSGQVEHLAQFFDVNAVIDRAARSL